MGNGNAKLTGVLSPKWPGETHARIRFSIVFVLGNDQVHYPSTNTHSCTPCSLSVSRVGPTVPSCRTLHLNISTELVCL